jgi:hypothetical protein
MTFDERKALVQVAFRDAGEEALLGATAFEGLGFMVDLILWRRNSFRVTC